MEKFKEVKEFDLLTCNKDYDNKDKYKYIEKETFEELIKFIHEYDTYKEYEDSSDILDFMKIGYRRDVGDIISIKNYVGLIQTRKGFKLQILPKISFDKENENNNKETKEIFIKMLKTMKDFPNKVFTDAELKISNMDIYEIFINMYLQEVKKLIKTGIKSAYIEKEENLPYYKGKIIFNEHIKANLIHKERFYVEYDEFQINRPENKIIKATLIKLQKISSDSENLKMIKEMLYSFEAVQVSTNYKSDLEKAIIDRNTKKYGVLMKWSKIFLLNRSFSTFAGKNSARALLIPMEKLFEGYVRKYVKKIFEKYGYNVITQEKNRQEKNKYLFDEPSKKFKIEPDLVVRKNERIIIMDTKWKILYDNERKNYGISEADMYQMYAYAKKYKTNEVILLYPTNNNIEEDKKIEFKSEDISVKVYFIDLRQIETSIENLYNLIKER